MSTEANKNLKNVVHAVLITLVLAGCQKEAKATLAEVYFPLQVGNSWTYTKTSGSGPSELTFTIIRTQQIDSHTYYVFNDYFNIYPPPPGFPDFRPTLGRELPFRYDSTGDKVIVRWGSGDLIIRYDFSGGEWDPGPGFALARLRQTGVTYSVPAGEFSDCAYFEFADAVWGEYLAPNVGSISYANPDGTFELQSYTIVPEPNVALLVVVGGLFLRKRNK